MAFYYPKPPIFYILPYLHFSTRRYASAVLAGHVLVYLCLCLSQVGVLTKWLNESTRFLAFMELSSTYSTVRYKIWVTPNIRVLPSGNLSQAIDFRKFHHGKLIVWSPKLVDGRACCCKDVTTPVHIYGFIHV